MGWGSTGAKDVIEDEINRQALAREWGSVYTLRQRTRVTEVRGLTRSAALTYGTDVSYFTVQNWVAHYFAHYTRTVKRRKADPSDGWTVTITETWAAVYQDGEWLRGAAESYFTDANPTECVTPSYRSTT